MKVKYIRFFKPGFIFAEESTVKWEGRPMTPPAGCYGYDVMEREEVTAPDSDEVLKGQMRKLHGFLFGEELTQEQVAKRFPNEDILLSNMRNNGYKTVCRTCTENFVTIPLDSIVLPASKAKDEVWFA